MIPSKFQNKILKAQRNELSEHFIYKKLAESIKDTRNKDILNHIAKEELKHYYFWKNYTGKDLKPDKLKIWLYLFISKLLGITFSMKLMEKGEKHAYSGFDNVLQIIPQAQKIMSEEDTHENELLSLIDEKKLKYVGSIVLGLNDALVELTGALAGFTLALQNTRLIAVTGLITGVAAALSMGASEYLSTKTTEDHDKNPLTASFYTGLTYLVTVFF